MFCHTWAVVSQENGFLMVVSGQGAKSKNLLGHIKGFLAHREGILKHWQDVSKGKIETQVGIHRLIGISSCHPSRIPWCSRSASTMVPLSANSKNSTRLPRLRCLSSPTF